MILIPELHRFSFSLDNRDYQQLAELLLLVKKRSGREIEGSAAQAFLVQITLPRL